MILIDPDGMAYRPTKDSTGAYNGFEWEDDKEANRPYLKSIK